MEKDVLNEEALKGNPNIGDLQFWLLCELQAFESFKHI